MYPKKIYKISFIFLISILLVGCAPVPEEDRVSTLTETGTIIFEGEEKVTIEGYDGHIMEPFLSRDGQILIFNDSNAQGVNTNLHWSRKKNDVIFEYRGEITGINSTELDGVGTMDENGNLYFVSMRDYIKSLGSVYQTQFDDGKISSIVPVEGVSRNIAGWINFDAEINASGDTLYSVDGRFDARGGPHEADIVMAKKVGTKFERAANSDEILKNVNTKNLEYAAAISADNLELYFTRIYPPITANTVPEILVSTRKDTNEPFSIPSKIPNITGFVEAATLSPDSNILYYHKRENGLHSLYLTRRVR